MHDDILLPGHQDQTVVACGVGIEAFLPKRVETAATGAPGVSGFRGTVALSSWTSPSGANASGDGVLLSADAATPTVPVIFTTTSSGAGGVPKTWTGQLVAVIPEPSSLALVGLGLAPFAAWNAVRHGERMF